MEPTYLFVCMHYPTQNHFALLLEMLLEMRQTRTEIFNPRNIDIGEGKAQKCFLPITEEPAWQGEDAKCLRKGLGNLDR